MSFSFQLGTNTLTGHAHFKTGSGWQIRVLSVLPDRGVIQWQLTPATPSEVELNIADIHVVVLPTPLHLDIVLNTDTVSDTPVKHHVKFESWPDFLAVSTALMLVADGMDGDAVAAVVKEQMFATSYRPLPGLDPLVPTDLPKPPTPAVNVPSSHRKPTVPACSNRPPPLSILPPAIPLPPASVLSHLSPPVVSLLRQGRRTEALSAQSAVTASKRENITALQKEWASTLCAMGAIQGQRGHLEKAVHLYAKAMEIRREVLGPSHKDLAATVRSMAKLRAKQGHTTQAVDAFRLAVGIYSLALEPQSLVVGVVLEELAEALVGTDNDDAFRTFHRAVAIRRSVLGESHASVGAAFLSFADVVRTKGNAEDSVMLYSQAAIVLPASLGRRHPDHGRCLVHLANVLMTMAATDAQKLAAQADTAPDTGTEAETPRGHDTLVHMWTEAQICIIGALEPRIGTHETDGHDEVADVLDRLGWVRLWLAWAMPKPAKAVDAVDLHGRVFQIRTVLFGDSHPLTVRTKHNLVAAKQFVEQGAQTGTDSDPVSDSDALAITDTVLGASDCRELWEWYSVTRRPRRAELWRAALVAATAAEKKEKEEEEREKAERERMELEELDKEIREEKERTERREAERAAKKAHSGGGGSGDSGVVEGIPETKHSGGE